METELLHGALLVLIGMGAGFVQRVSGFGLGIFAMLFLPHFMAVPTAAASISTLFSCATTSYNALRYRKQVHYKTALPMICAALVTIPVAVAFSAKVSARVFQMLLGGVFDPAEFVLSVFQCPHSDPGHFWRRTAGGRAERCVGGIVFHRRASGGAVFEQCHQG